MVGILGHEMGHWKMWHTVQGFVLGNVYMLLMFYCFGRSMGNATLFASFGFASQPTIIGLMLFSQTLWAPVDKVLSFASNCKTRRDEFQADAFSVGLGYGAALQRGLTKISLKSLGNMVPDAWYSVYHFTHPPLVERLGAIQALMDAGAREKRD